MKPTVQKQLKIDYVSWAPNNTNEVRKDGMCLALTLVFFFFFILVFIFLSVKRTNFFLSSTHADIFMRSCVKHRQHVTGRAFARILLSLLNSQLASLVEKHH